MKIQFMQALFDSASDAIVVTDREGCVVAWNPGAIRIFGYTADEAIGQSLDIIIPEPMRARHWAGFHRFMETQKSRYGAGDMLAVPALTKSGQRISTEFTMAIVRDENALPIGVVAVMRDVSATFVELKKLRDALAGRERPRAV